MVTQSGMVLDGTLDRLEGPPATRADEDPDKDGIANEIPRSLVDYLEFYLLNYFKPATYKITQYVKRGRVLFDRIGCNGCHIANLTLRRDRRVADVETVYDAERGLFNNLFATATPLFRPVDDGTSIRRSSKRSWSRSRSGTSLPTSSGMTSAPTSTSATTTAPSSANS